MKYFVAAALVIINLLFLAEVGSKESLPALTHSLISQATFAIRSTPTASPTLTQVTTPTATATGTFTATPTATATGTSTATATATATSTATATATATATVPPPPTVTPMPYLQPAHAAGGGVYPTLADFWDGTAEFVVEVQETGLPAGESETIVMGNGELWSYLHASERAAGTRDRCGATVPFPGCTIIYRSYNGGFTFSRDEAPICQFDCQQCPCNSYYDHVDQQQYPDVFYDGQRLWLVYEYKGRVMLRDSVDGLTWSRPVGVAATGIWKRWLRGCPSAEAIGAHPFVPYDYECLAGGPPGIFVDGEMVYVFMAVGQSPGGIGCYYGHRDASPTTFQRCAANPLFRGAATYGPLDVNGAAANEFFDFRTISSAEVQRIGEGDAARYYMLYEGIRGPGPGSPGDSQFGLGLARSLTNQIDGPWEKFPGNPILVDSPGNIGLGHADLVVLHGQTLLYTSLEGVHRSRLALVWKEPESPQRVVEPVSTPE